MPAAAKTVKSALYSLLIRKVTRVHYEQLLEELPDGARVLDVGIGNGLMLDHFADAIRAHRIHIDGIDIDEAYLAECERRIRQHGLEDLVRCRHRDVMELLADTEPLPRHVYFSTSFMLLPDQGRALDLLAKRLPPGGRAMFAQTLLTERNKLVEWVKPKLKYLTSVDFGRAQYRDDFLRAMERRGFALEREQRFERVSGNKHVYFHAFRAPAAE